jgi:hypothetical protein
MLLLYPQIVRLADETPEADDVVAGPWGALMFVLLIAATVFLCFSFLKQMRKAKEARDRGVYGDPPSSRDDAGTDADQDHPGERRVSGE